MLDNVTEISMDQLAVEVWKAKQDKYRFVTMTCCDLMDAHDILYHFDKQYVLKHLRLRLPKGTALPSISTIFFAAVLVENEIKDLFGIEVTGLTIDYKGRFMLSDGAPVAPMNKAHLGIGLEIRDTTRTGTAGEAAP
ncbi:MAG: NADH-quinone oxidoreductase subunit C [bacterium]